MDPKYRALAADVAAHPSKYRGQLVALMDKPASGERPPDWFDFDALADFNGLHIIDGFKLIRVEHNEKLYVILIERNSTQSQANHGRGLQAMIRQGLEYARELGAQVAGIAVDVDGGDEADRPAVSEAMEWIHNGWAHALLAPAITRLDRKETLFASRMEELAECESWVYYSCDYSGSALDYCAWNEISTRAKAVEEVRKGEDYLNQGRAGVRASYQNKLEQDWMVSGKEPRFCMYAVSSLNPRKPRSEQPIGMYIDAPAAYLDIRDRIIAGAAAKDANALPLICKDYSAKRGYEIHVKDLAWELRIGWIEGLNRVSPDGAVDLVVESPLLKLEFDSDMHALLMSSLDELLSLKQRSKATQPRVNELPESEKHRLDEVLQKNDSGMRLALACTCKSSWTLMRSVGKAEADAMGVPRDWVICDSCCTGGSGSKGKVRAPRAKDLRQYAKLPENSCRKCTGFTGLYESTRIQVDELSWQVYGCKSCMIPAAALGPAKSMIEDFDEPGLNRDAASTIGSDSRSLMDF